MKHFYWIFALLATLTLAGCSLPQSTPRPATATPGPSSTPTASTTPRPSTTPTASPTPMPATRILSGEQALQNGKTDEARREFETALQTSPDPETRAQALLGLAKTSLLERNTPRALETLRALTQNYPNSPQAARGNFLLAETYLTLERYEESAQAYAAYLEKRPGYIDAYAQERRGDALYAAGKWPEALDAYQAALRANSLRDANLLALKIANTYAAARDHATALQLYDNIFNATDNDYLKAQLDLLAGRVYMNMGQASDGYARWKHTVENYPLAIDSYFALVGLVDAGQPVNEFDRGLVDYFAAQYDVALAAFDRSLAQNPAHDGTVLHYRALTNRALGNHEQAIADWDKLITGYPDNRFWSAAWTEKAYTQWAYFGRYAEAAKTLQGFVTAAPGSAQAANALLNAARIYERGNMLDESVMLWLRMAEQYPSDPAVVDALFQAGIIRYRQGNYPEALGHFQRSLLLAQDESIKARAALWAGKCYQRSNDMENAKLAWQQAQALSPGNYYSLRARDLLFGRAPFEAAYSTNYEVNLADERKKAAAWLIVKFNLPVETDLYGPGALANDPRMIRGLEFWQLGLYDLARLEFESLREAVKDNPADSFRLANALLDLGAYRPGIFALRQVLTLAGMDDHSESLTAPAYFGHVRYGLYYSNIIFPAAQEFGMDPLFLSSLVRQESLFEGFVRSSAGARGLAQIMPATGAGIAEQMGWPPNYSPEDLYNPSISVRMGAFYFNSNRKLFNGDLYAALAAYNGGPGNASVWRGLAKDDMDLFVEVVRFAETRDYIRRIYETFYIYRSIYGIGE